MSSQTHRPHTHAYGEGDEAEDNAHEYHGMSSSQMAAMFAKQRGEISPGKSGTPFGPRPGKATGERASPSVLKMPSTKGAAPTAKNPLTGKTPSTSLGQKPNLKHFAPEKSSSKGKAETVKAPKAAKVKKESKGGHGNPLQALGKIAGAAKTAAVKTAGSAVVATGQEPVVGGVAKSLKGHRYGSEDEHCGRGGRHDDR